MVPSAALSPKAQQWMRALGRATAERIVVFRISPASLGVAAIVEGTWTAKPYTLAIVGERPQDLVCSCPAGARGTLCKHLAAGTFARRHGVYARKPLLPSTPAEIAHTEATKRAVIADLVARAHLTGIDPLSEMYA